MRERIIEAYLVRKVRAAGGMCIKNQKVKDFPDRSVYMPGAAFCLAETKPAGGKPRAGQARMHAKLWKLGFPVIILDSKALVDSFVRSFSKR